MATERAKAIEILADDLHAAEVREAEALWRSRSISAVPAMVVESKWLINCGRPAVVLEEALLKMAGAAACARCLRTACVPTCTMSVQDGFTVHMPLLVALETVR